MFNALGNQINDRCMIHSLVHLCMADPGIYMYSGMIHILITEATTGNSVTLYTAGRASNSYTPIFASVQLETTARTEINVPKEANNASSSTL